ncbi:MAG: adenine methyltransferase [Deltaproteobacteria bacterium]|nr:MAG: adenine methyltransferase [Deltaproteobacteria bacterium]
MAGFTHDSVKNKTVDWWTPKWVFDELGLRFDLDPSAPLGGVPWIPVDRVYSIEDDGLLQPWSGRVWLNPPYGKHTAKWLAKMHAHRNGVALVFARTDCRWFHDYLAKSDALLFLKGRISFIDGLGVVGKKNSAGAGSVLAAWGDDCVEALAAMARRGHGLFVRLWGQNDPV